MDQKLRGITVGTLVVIMLVDLFKDFIKQTLVSNKCNIDDT